MAEKQIEFETQKQRWLKYGGNVVLSVVVVILLATAACYLAQRYDRRADMTLSRSYSLKPQTLNILNDVKQKVTLVSLYSKPRPDDRSEKASDTASQYQAVQDLLEEYQRKGHNIDTETIDPAAERGKLEELISKATATYGAEAKQYKDFLDQFAAAQTQFSNFGANESVTISKLPLDKISDEATRTNMQDIRDSFAKFKELLDNAKKNADASVKQTIPDYRGATDEIRTAVSAISDILDQINKIFTPMKAAANLPAEVKEYVTGAIPRCQSIKSAADEVTKKIDSLGALKLDALRDQLRVKSILVMGENDFKIIPFSAVWKTANARGFGEPGVTPQMQFAGEQQVSTALMQLNRPNKPKVCFVRPGGGPLTQAMMGPSAPFAEIADRLRNLGFDVSEKDLSGQWEMQAQMQQVPAPPEPTEEQIKDAVWIVLDFAPAMGQQGPNPMGPKLAEHLKQGGSALVLALPQADPLDAALGDFGVSLDTSAIVVHEAIKGAPAGGGDMIEQAQRIPTIFITSQYGDNPIGKPLTALDAMLAPLLPVKVTTKSGYTSWPMIPVPRDVKTWASHDAQKSEDTQDVTFNAATDTLNTDADPLYGGAMVEKAGGGRLVVLGSLRFALDQMLVFPDMEVLRNSGRIVSRFPGNGELLTNSVYWLTKMDSMMAISPSAMQVSRIKAMSDGTQMFIKAGVLLVALPGLILLIGATVYVKRQD